MFCRRLSEIVDVSATRYQM